MLTGLVKGEEDKTSSMVRNETYSEPFLPAADLLRRRENSLIQVNLFQASVRNRHAFLGLVVGTAT